MKGKQYLGLVLTSLLILSGCSSTVSENGKDVVASIDGTNILADDMYTTLSSSSRGQAALFDCVLKEIINKNFPVTDDMKAQAEGYVENAIASYQVQYGSDAEEQLEAQLVMYGFGGIDDYEQYLIEQLQTVEFMKQYVKDHYDDVFEDYYKTTSPRMISIIKVSMTDVDSPTDEENDKLQEVEKLLKAGKDFGETAASYSDDSSSSAKGNIGIIDSSSDLSSTYGSKVNDKALSLKENEVSKAIKGTDGYYFLKCTSASKEAIKEELKVVDLESPLLTYDNYMTYLAFQSYELTYNDADIEKVVKDYIQKMLDLRAEERGAQ